MITNIKDKRKNYAKSDQLDFVIEPSYTDNCLPEGKYYPEDDTRINFMYEELLKSSIAEGIAWANAFEGPVTLFIYDDLHGSSDPSVSLFAAELDLAFNSEDNSK